MGLLNKIGAGVGRFGAGLLATPGAVLRSGYKSLSEIPQNPVVKGLSSGIASGYNSAQPAKPSSQISSYDSQRLKLGNTAKSPSQNLQYSPPTLPQSQTKPVITQNGTSGASQGQGGAMSQFSQGNPTIPVVGSTPPPVQDNPSYYSSGNNPNTGAYQRDGVPQYSPLNQNPGTEEQNPQQMMDEQSQRKQQAQYDPRNSGLYGQMIADLANRSQQSGADYQTAQARFNDIAKQQTELSNQQAQKTFEIGARPGDVSQATGEQGLLNQLFASRQAALTPQYNAAATALGAANTQQQAQYNALGTAIGAAAPDAYGLTQQPFNRVTGQFGGNQSIGERAEQAGNVQSIQDLTQQKSQIQSIFNGADANFKLLLDTAQQGGVNNGDIPALNALQQNVSRGLTSNSAVINFQNTLAAVRSLYAQILGGGTTTVDSQNRAEQAIPNSISLNALRSLGTQLQSESTNRIAGISNQIKSMQGTQSNGTTNQPNPWH